MASFEDFLNKAKDLAEVATQKTNDVVETSKLKYSKMQINTQVKQTYERLGNSVYLMKKSGNFNEPLLDKYVAEVDRLLDQLRKADQKIDDINKVITCPNCSSRNDRDAVFCSKCGSRLRRQEGETQE